MYLIHLIRRFIDFIFPVAYKNHVLQAQDELWPYDDKRFSGHALHLVYPNLKINKQEDKKLWIVHSLNSLTPYLFFNSVGITTSKALIRDTAKCIITKLPLVDGKCYLRLVEYKYPSRTKMRVGKSDEVLFADIRIETCGRVYNGFKIDFYI